jgi:3-dehydrosphinganine reductase
VPCRFAILSCNMFFLSLGVQNGNFHIVGDLIGHLFRSSTRGATPHNNVILDAIYSFIGWVRPVLCSVCI